jgi:exonuclease III
MKIISLNMEGDKHIDKIIKLLEKEKADIVCFSEIFEEDIKFLTPLIDIPYIFAHECYRQSMVKNNADIKTFGVAIFSKNITWSNIFYVVGNHNLIPKFQKSANLEEKPHELYVPAITVKIQFNNKEYFITNTHLVVTEKGESTDYSFEQATKLVNYLKEYPEMIICGDFNSPRGGGVFDYFCKFYKDNIPNKYKTSLDQNLHRVKKLKFMVDVLFSTKNYTVENVKLVDGVSDHMAVIAQISL